MIAIFVAFYPVPEFKFQLS